MKKFIIALLIALSFSLFFPSSTAAEINTLWTGEIAVLVPGRGYVMMQFYPDRHGQVVGFAEGWLLIVEEINGTHGRGIIYDNEIAWETDFYLNTVPNILAEKWIVVDMKDAVEFVIPHEIIYPQFQL